MTTTTIGTNPTANPTNFGKPRNHPNLYCRDTQEGRV
jgi:hypothetical protein